MLLKLNLILLNLSCSMYLFKKRKNPPLLDIHNLIQTKQLYCVTHISVQSFVDILYLLTSSYTSNPFLRKPTKFCYWFMSLYFFPPLICSTSATWIFRNWRDKWKCMREPRLLYWSVQSESNILNVVSIFISK